MLHHLLEDVWGRKRLSGISSVRVYGSAIVEVSLGRQMKMTRQRDTAMARPASTDTTPHTALEIKQPRHQKVKP